MPQLDLVTYSGTRACADYVDDASERLRMFVAALELAEDQVQPPDAVAEKFAENLDPLVSFRDWFDRQIAETLLTRAVDGFLTYLGDLLALVYEANPNALPGDANIPVSLAPELESRGPLVREMAGRRVRNLSRKGIDALNRPFHVLRFPLCRSAEERNAIGRIIAQRDLIVHSRGVVDRTYGRRVPDSQTPMGEPLPLTRSEAVDDALLLMETAVRMDRAAVERWGFDTAEIHLGPSEPLLRGQE